MTVDPHFRGPPQKRTLIKGDFVELTGKECDFVSRFFAPKLGINVARQGIDALLSGDDHVYAASMKTKLEGKLANLVPGALKGAMHEKMAKPKDEKETA
jgi:hypothetical protein